MLITQTIKWFFIITICFCIQIFFPSTCLSNNKIDSLQAIIKTSKEDTNKLNTLNFLSYCLLIDGDLEKGYMYANQTLELAQKLGIKKRIRSAYQNIVTFYYYKGNMELSLEYLKKRGALIDPGNKIALENFYSDMSAMDIEQHLFDTAMYYSEKALQIAVPLKDSILIAVILGNRGLMYANIADYSTALNYLFQSLKISEVKNNKEEIVYNYRQIAKLYCLEGKNNDKALYYYQLSLKLAQELGNKYKIACAFFGLGSLYDNNQNYGPALDYYQQALSIFQQLGNIPNEGSCICNVARIYGDYGQYNKAIELTTKAMELAKQGTDKSLLGTTYENLGALYMKMKNYDTAVTYLNQSINIAKTIGEKNDEASGLLGLAQCYEGLNNYKLAFHTLMQCKQLKDSILNDETIQKTLDLEALYNFDKKEKEIALLTKDKKIQELEIKKQASLKYTFMGGLIIACILFFFMYRSYRIRQLFKLHQLRIKIADDLHDDVGSTLSSIFIFSEMARKQSKEVEPMLDQISKSSQQMLESMADIVWTIKPDNDNFENIISRMKSFAYQLLRTKHIDFEFNTDDSIGQLYLPMNVRKNLYLIFKEALNNMIKYSEANRASFSISNTKNGLTMLIRDNGKGFDVNQKIEGNGLTNMKKRASEMGAKFFIESGYGIGTSIQLLINLA